MKPRFRFQIRQKIMLSLLSVLTVVVSLVTFTMARFFHEDKRAYINDWVSIAAVNTAEECDSLLTGYRQRLQTFGEVLSSESLEYEEKQSMLRRLFDELPELLSLTLYEEGEEIRRADNVNALEQIGLTAEDLKNHYVESPLPVERIREGEVHVVNATLSPELPAFTLTFPTDPADEEKSATIVSAYIDSASLLELGARFKVFHVELADPAGGLLAHPDRQRLIERGTTDLFSETRSVHEAGRAGLTTEFVDADGREMIGGFAPVSFGGLTVSVQVPASAAYLASRELLRRLLMVTLVLLIVAALSGLFWAHRITGPMERLSRATREIGRGDFEVQVATESRDEIGDLARSFNRMASELKGREEKLAEANAQLVQSEKLAAFGELGAGIAHEVKNPLAGILGCAQISLLELEDKEMLKENLQLIEKETGRCKTIIENLLRFARQEKAVLEPTEINQVVVDAMAIVNHQLEMHQVRLETQLSDDLPLINGNGNQLQQVLMNLMMNAQQAMGGEKGYVTVTTRLDETGRVEVAVHDDGPGMPEKVQQRIFEPFFSTKPSGKGTGLGLSVSFGIVKDHGGDIVVESEVGTGTTFRILLPVAAEVVLDVFTDPTTHRPTAQA